MSSISYVCLVPHFRWPVPLERPLTCSCRTISPAVLPKCSAAQSLPQEATHSKFTRATIALQSRRHNIERLSRGHITAFAHGPLSANQRWLYSHLTLTLYPKVSSRKLPPIPGLRFQSESQFPAQFAFAQPVPK
ncbi:hypothetical protein MPTK1_7g01870 [Marchantia polymorpha subsp. ruderalis]|uniref:Uncharacterized protein n=2 Tax=Marchantia polymorpha TaxID=3197 RepID=A0AAF6BV76_MARPO|nr:hypothetical protein MARPO_0099s0060 [Marchantia polymorpha]BBN15910.1 hypothetical protein Mp_7g01870 [Marchantia polymorpha subsp. ruderalis]|eukprot:PTQ32438.1 hypothetical protein MARPO_0099s0060 [Marchantia polymorpha]